MILPPNMVSMELREQLHEPELRLHEPELRLHEPELRLHEPHSVQFTPTDDQRYCTQNRSKKAIYHSSFNPNWSSR